MSSNPQEIGTLIVVVLKANHLPNKRHIGKQDPYCVVTVNGDKRRTKAIKRGGQHPEWDEEIRFTLLEEPEESSGGSSPKSARKPKKIKGGMMMKVACFADDPREPDFIGETDVDLTEVLTKGETDEWFTLSNKEKFAGKVYLELTFWSNEPAPEKKVSKPQKTNKYAGPGYFNPMDEHTSSSQTSSPSRISSGPEQPIKVPNPKAQSELLYDPPYLQKHRTSTLDRVSNDFGELDVTDRRTSSQSGHFMSASVSSGFSKAPTPQPTHSFDFSTPDQRHGHSYDSPVTPAVHTQPQQPATVPSSLLPGRHDVAPVNGYQHPNRRSRIPVSSSGFVPIHGSTSMSSLPSEPVLSSYNSPIAPHNTQYSVPVYTSALSQTPAPAPAVPYAPNPLAPQAYQLAQPIQYQYTSTIAMPAPAIATSPSYMSPPAPAGHQAQQMNAHNVSYINGSGPSPTHEQTLQSPQVHPTGLTIGNGSRPLPAQPQNTFCQPQMTGAYPTSQAMPPQHTIQSNNVAYQPPVPFPSIQQAPPPPPAPPHNVSYNTQAYVPDTQPAPSAPPQGVNYNTQTYVPDAHPPPPPPPPPETEQAIARARRRSSLPRPPVNYVQTPPPPPPPLPINNYLQNPLPPPPPPPLQGAGSQIQFNHPGPPPKPPVMVGNQCQWLPPLNTQPLQNGYGPVA